MPGPVKPAFLNPTPAAVSARLDALAAKLDVARTPDGGVDMRALARAVEQSGDAALEKELFWVRSSFETVEKRTVTGGCGGSYVDDVRVPPERLSAADVQSVRAALVEAKRRIADRADADSSGRIERGEAERIPALGDDLAGRLADAAVRGVMIDYRAQLAGWQQALNGVADQVDPRRGLHVNIDGRAEQHCETKLGRDAVRWAYRKLAVDDGLSSEDVWGRMDRDLKGAERSLLRFVPFLGGDDHGPHLNDGEVKKLVGRQDLAAFVADTKAAVEAKLGRSWDDWVAGKDLPGADQLADGDFRRTTSSGC